jgi:hypothetical protein
MTQHLDRLVEPVDVPLAEVADLLGKLDLRIAGSS